MMEVFAAYGAHVDHHMGRVIDAVKQLPGAENTLFLYIAGDNGASAEGGIEGSVNENLFFNGFPEKWQDNLRVIDELGGPRHFNHFPSAWAHAMDTPFQWIDLAASHPQKLRELQDLWWVEAARYNVLPLDWRAVERLNAELMGRPSLTGNRKTFTYYPGQVGLPNEAAPRILNKSWTLTADIEVPEGGAEGMIATHGGLVGGYGLYVREGKPTFVYNYLALDRSTVAGKEPLPRGKVQLKVDFVYGSGGEGLCKAAAVTLSVNGARVAEGRLPKTIPIQISLGERMDVGMDVGSAVDFTCKPPFKFTGKIEKVTVELK
jgi:hypothetical protein